MRKKILAGLFAALLCTTPALAEVYSGVTVALQTQTILAETSGTLESINVISGEQIDSGDILATFQTTKVFANQDGHIARILAEEATDIEDAVLELQPISRYTIHCTVDDAYASTATGLVHSGETLCLRCTYNGTHRGTAIVNQIDGNIYLAEATGGEFYVGETVYLYRDADFTSDQRVGIGTVVSSNVESYSAEGKLVHMHVKEGEYVQRGELLYEVINGENSQVVSRISGYIQNIEVQQGEQVKAGQALFTIVVPKDICVEVEVDESTAAQMQIGDPAALSFAVDAEEKLVPGEIISISRLGTDGNYSIIVLPETPAQYLGMSVAVRFS